MLESPNKMLVTMIKSKNAQVVKLVDTRDLKSLEGNFVPVQVRPWAPDNNMKTIYRYVERILFIFYKLRLSLGYSASIKNIRTPREKVREILHAIDKASSLEHFDKNRIKKRYDQIQDLGGIKSEWEENISLLRKIEGESIFEDVNIPSIRKFSKGIVEESVIKNAIIHANKCPKSCSRDSVKVYEVSDKNELVNCFSGYTCFENDEDTKLLVIVVKLDSYDQRAEFFAPLH